MADVVIGTKQTVVFYFLTADGSSPIEIYGRVRNGYGGDSMNVGSDAGPVVVKRKLAIVPAATAATMVTTEKVDKLIRDNRPPQNK
jgi:hypothetical protein